MKKFKFSQNNIPIYSMIFIFIIDIIFIVVISIKWDNGIGRYIPLQEHIEIYKTAPATKQVLQNSHVKINSLVYAELNKLNNYFIYLLVLFFVMNILTITLFYYFRSINKKLFDKLNHSNEFLEVIRAANQLMMQIKNPILMIKSMTNILTSNKHIFSTAWIALYDKNELFYEIVGSDESKEFLSFKSVLKNSSLPKCISPIGSKNLLIIKEALKVCDKCTLRHSYIDNNAILIRLEHKEKTYGIMCLSVKEAYLYSKDDHSILLEVADDIAFALHNIEIESQLALNEKKFENIFDNAEVSIWNEDLTHICKTFKHLRVQGVTDLRKYLKNNPKVKKSLAKSVKVRNVNYATLKLFGASSEESFLSQIDKSFGPGAMDVFTEELCAIWEGKESFRSEVNFSSFDARIINAIISFKIPKTQEGFASVPVTILDITDLKKAEKKQKLLSNIIDESVNEIYIFNNELLNFLYVNRAACTNLGYTLEEMKRLTPLDIKPSVTPEEFYNLIHKLNISNDKKTYFSSFHERNDGSTYPVDIYLQSIKYANQNAFLAIIIDTTERELNQKKLLDKEKIMIAQSRHAAMGEMIGMIAHQWRQPLSVIAMGANNLTLDIDFEQLNQESIKNESQNIIKQTEYLSKTIDDFRNFFRPDKEIENIRVEDILNEAKKIVGKSLESENIKLSIEYKNSYTVKTYSRELLQVYINLLNNAKEAIVENRAIERRIHMMIDVDKDYVITTFCDNGGGINQKILDKIFDPYFSTKNIKSGTGLGLYISKIIVENHLHGKIEVNNNNDGACFKISIPIKWRERTS